MICPNWQYLITLDADLTAASRFVHIHQSNFDTHSIEFVRLLLAAGSEIDVVAKLLCKTIEENKKYKTINDYRETITTKFPKFHEMVIDLPQYELQIQPWADWKNDKNPSWWKAYNDVKHHRDRKYKYANLKNTINSIAALFVMVWYLHHEDRRRKKHQKTTLFSAKKYIDGVVWANSYSYKIPEEI